MFLGGYAYTLSEQEKSRTEKIEEDLARARAAIQKAINNQIIHLMRTLNFTFQEVAFTEMPMLFIS